MVKVIKDLRINHGLVCQYEADHVELDLQTKDPIESLLLLQCPLANV